ncbi:MAG: DUF4286 family protein [Flavobacteriaceae bacterium]|jgi:hypothetical protein|nr:DUF4286 family protein [Flavobacteriaceae bacterium]MDG0967299.1 DUF4286 family protein [Flavobacteriaceae bacterium]
MRILNITFSIDPSVEDEFVFYVKGTLLPLLSQKGSLLRIRSDANTHPTYGLQIECETEKAFQDFKDAPLASIYQAMHTKFPNKWVSFDTELERIAP